MDQRTLRYLRGRFGDHYRRLETVAPPAFADREWGYIPWTTQAQTRMRRHQALRTERDLRVLLTDDRPRHVYYSAGRYDHPGANQMDEKGWQGADLIFDLDADHLPTVDPEAATYPAMLAACKEELQCLLSFLRTDFGVEDPAIVFSGGRGYHVHVRAPQVRGLDREARRQIVDYVRGAGVELESILDRERVVGTGRETPADKRTLAPGGWGRRIHESLLDFLGELQALSDGEALDRLQTFEGIGAARAESILEAMRDRQEELQAGNVDVHPAMIVLLEALLPEAIAEHQAAIDEPVTTDVHRLIRLPGSLHGGTGLMVTPLTQAELPAFDPLTDAVAPTFKGQRITVEVTQPGPVFIGDENRHVDQGTTVLPEPVGVFLLASGRARKCQEPRRQ